LDRGVPVLPGSAVGDLVVVDGAVLGVSGAVGLIGARRGVILASGGFEWNPSMVKSFIGIELDPMSPPGNEGDGQRMAMEAGAELANMTSFWGQPGIREPGFELDGRNVPQMGSIRSTPGVIAVNRHGR